MISPVNSDHLPVHLEQSTRSLRITSIALKAIAVFATTLALAAFSLYLANFAISTVAIFEAGSIVAFALYILGMHFFDKQQMSNDEIEQRNQSILRAEDDELFASEFSASHPSDPSSSTLQDSNNNPDTAEQQMTNDEIEQRNQSVISIEDEISASEPSAPQPSILSSSTLKDSNDHSPMFDLAELKENIDKRQEKLKKSQTLSDHPDIAEQQMSNDEISDEVSVSEPPASSPPLPPAQDSNKISLNLDTATLQKVRRKQLLNGFRKQLTPLVIALREKSEQESEKNIGTIVSILKFLNEKEEDILSLSDDQFSDFRSSLENVPDTKDENFSSKINNLSKEIINFFQ